MAHLYICHLPALELLARSSKEAHSKDLSTTKPVKMAIPTLRTDGSVETEVLYVKKTSTGAAPTTEQIYNEVAEILDVGTVNVRDVRTADQEFSMARTGFQFERVTTPKDIDYSDAKSVAEDLYPILEQFVAQK